MSTNEDVVFVVEVLLRAKIMISEMQFLLDSDTVINYTTSFSEKAKVLYSVVVNQESTKDNTINFIFELC